MKKIISLIITIALLFTSAYAVSAKSNASSQPKGKITQKDTNKDKDKHKEKENEKVKARKQTFKINGSPVIKYGRYILPISPVTKGMGASVSFDRAKAELTVVRGSTTVVINFKAETVLVNGVEDKKCPIFAAKSNNKTVVLIKYIAQLFGLKSNVGGDKVEIEVPGLNVPTDIEITSAGTVVKANTLNTTTQYMNVTAKIQAGQATGAKAELYVGSRLVATDSAISVTDKTVEFTTSDGTPTNAELQNAVPEGGVVTVRLYNAEGKYVTSTTKNPTLVADYIAPTLTGINSAVYNAAGNYLFINVTGAGAVNDTVDVTKFILTDASLGRSVTLTSTPSTGSRGMVSNENTLLINIGSYDRAALAGFGGTDVYLNIIAGALLTDAAGNALTIMAPILNKAVTVINSDETNGLTAPTNVTVTAAGINVKPNTLNSTTLYMLAKADITAGQATGGKAELYVGSKLVATDAVIGASDTTVDFTTSDTTPTNAELQAAVPAGGVVSVRLYNASGAYVTSAAGNPTLAVDYSAPTISGVVSAIYFPAERKLYITVSGAAAVGDIVDVTKISFNDASLARSYTLTNNSGTGSTGSIISSNTLIINVGTADKTGLTGFEGSDVTLAVAAASLLSDTAGNYSVPFTSAVIVPVTVIQ